MVSMWIKLELLLRLLTNIKYGQFHTASHDVIICHGCLCVKSSCHKMAMN